MQELHKVASEAISVLNETKIILEEVNGLVEAFKATVREVSAKLPKEIKVPKIVEEPYPVPVPQFEKVKVAGKIIIQD